MKDFKRIQWIGFLVAVCIFLVAGCTGKEGMEEGFESTKALPSITETSPAVPDKTETEYVESKPELSEPAEPAIVYADWSEFFENYTGAAVFYNSASKQYTVYNQELANQQRSPCSTFKIISSLIGLEHGMIIPGNSTHIWSGEPFWNEDWNKDIDFEEAFRTSCVWYFREIIDEIGQETMEKELNRLKYGNHDISDWEGRLNTNNSNRALTGFWIESSLKISPMEQVQVMERIFGSDTVYKRESIEQLKQVMLVTDYETEQLIYGKTGMGKVAGTVVDSWFTGFVDGVEEDFYFCIYLGETTGAEVSSKKAKDIAIKIISSFANTPMAIR